MAVWLILLHLRVLRRLREVRARNREDHLSLVRQMYGGMDEDTEAKAAEHDKWADGLGKVALGAVKTEDKYEQEMGVEALGRVKKGGK